MQFKPIANRIVIKPDPKKERIGSFYVPETSQGKELVQTGTVMAIADNITDKNGNPIPVEIQVGDIICFGKYSGAEITTDSVHYIVMNYSDVLMVL